MPYPHDLERDLEHTIPPEGGLDSRWLFAAMTRHALRLVAPRPGDRVLDLACGMGQDTQALAAMQAETGGTPGLTVGAEPSNRMIRFGQSIARGGEARAASTRIAWVRGFGETLPFRDGAFDAVLCKGAMDHFQSPTDAMREIARVLRPGGCVVIALANYDSLSCRLGRHREVRRAWMPGYVAEPHPYFEPPPDHLARFGYRDVLALAEPPLRLERVLGLSLLWLYPPWIAALARLPRPVAAALLALAFALGRAVPQWADVTIIRARRTS